MQPLETPKVTGVEVVATRPTDADSAAIDQLSAEENKQLPQVAYVIKIRLRTKPPVTSEGWALYVNDLRIPKYWEYEHGIYFKVFDPQFFAEHKGKKLRFSQNGVDFYDTGKKLPAPAERAPASRSKHKGTKSKGAKPKAARLPSQDDVLK